MKIRGLFNNGWIGKAILAGLKDALGDLEYTWGISTNDLNTDIKLTLLKNGKGTPKRWPLEGRTTFG